MAVSLGHGEDNIVTHNKVVPLSYIHEQYSLDHVKAHIPSLKLDSVYDIQLDHVDIHQITVTISVPS